MFGFGKKIGMTRLFIGDKATAVTVVQFSKQYLVQKKTIEIDGYNAIQIGSGKTKKPTKQLKGHSKNANLTFVPKTLGEFKIENLDDSKTTFDITDFIEEDLINVTGVTVGKGFTGAIKRHGFHGQPASHGHDHVRAVGSIGSRWPQRTLPGKKMAGRSGGENLTLNKQKLLAVDKDLNLLFIKGSLPGVNGSILKIQKANI
jgi:large subunit ribosomal protein L3